MPVFTRASHPDCAPFVEFAMLPQPLNLKPWQWPARDAYAPGLFLELGDELLTVVFRLTGRRFPWCTWAWGAGWG